MIPKLQQQAAAALVAWNVARLEANRLKAERGAIDLPAGLAYPSSA